MIRVDHAASASRLSTCRRPPAVVRTTYVLSCSSQHAPSCVVISPSRTRGDVASFLLPSSCSTSSLISLTCVFEQYAAVPSLVQTSSHLLLHSPQISFLSDDFWPQRRREAKRSSPSVTLTVLTMSGGGCLCLFAHITVSILRLRPTLVM